MPNTSGQGYAAGLRQGYIYALNANGRIAGNSATTPYMGISMLGAKQFNLTIPKQRKIFHINADRVAAADFLPPTEAASATFAIGAQSNMPLEAILTGNTQTFVGEASAINALSSQQGFEPLIGIMTYQEDLDATSRLRRWRTILVPRAKCIPMDAGMAEKELDSTYDVMFTPSSTDIFGTTLTAAADNAVDAQYKKLQAQGLPIIAAWIGNGYTVDFTFPVGYTPALSTAKVAVYLNGVKQTGPAVTITTAKVTFAVAPIVTDDITIYWEY